MSASETTSTLVSVKAWRDAAIADQWIAEPMFEKADADELARLSHPEGFVAHVVARIDEAVIKIWGPDKLAIMPPNAYCMNAVRAGQHICEFCRATNIPTTRVGFANRACLTCAPAKDAAFLSIANGMLD